MVGAEFFVAEKRQRNVLRPILSDPPILNFQPFSMLISATRSSAPDQPIAFDELNKR